MSAWGAASLYQSPPPLPGSGQRRHLSLPLPPALALSRGQVCQSPSFCTPALLTEGLLAYRRLPQSRASQQEGPQAAAPPDKEQAGLLWVCTWARHTGSSAWYFMEAFPFLQVGKWSLERISAPRLYFYNPRAQWNIESHSQPCQLLTAFLPSYSDGAAMCLTQLLRSA